MQLTTNASHPPVHDQPPVIPTLVPPDLEAKTRKVIEVSRETLQSAVRDLKGAATCHEEKTGESVAVTLYARKEFYPLGKYELEEAPSALLLAQWIAVLDGALLKNQGPNFWVSSQVRGAADAVIPHNIEYVGGKMQCSTNEGMVILERGKELDNNKLACARAAKFVQYLAGKGLPLESVLIAGSGSGEIGGRYRYVDVTLTFHNILRWHPDASFCG
jgi:hypothetical protein